MATTGTSVTIRNIAKTDAVAVAELSTQLGYPSAAADIERRFDTLTNLGGDHVILVAELDGEVVGWGESEVCRHIQSEPYALLTGLVVKDGVRSAGVGRQLCGAIEDWVRSREVAVLRVTSRSTRERAHQFYLRGGYTELKLSKVFEKAL